MTEQKQIDKFKEAARKLRCNESENDFDRKLGQLVEKKPKPKK